MESASKIAAAWLLVSLGVTSSLPADTEPGTKSAPPAAGATTPAPQNVPPAVNVTRENDQTNVHIAAPQGQIQARLAPGNSAVRLQDRRGTTVELSRPPYDPNAEQPPQLKDLILKSLFQSLGTHRTVRLGRMQIHIETPPETAPAEAVPDANLELGAPAAPEDGEAAPAPLPKAPAARIPEQSAVSPATPSFREARRVPRNADDGQAAAANRLKKKGVALPEVELQEEEAPPSALPAQRKPARILQTQAQEIEPATPVLPRSVPNPIAETPLAPLVPIAVVPNPAAADLAAVQKELAQLKTDLEEMSHKRSVRGKSLQNLVRKISETNNRLESARKKLEQ